MQIKKFIYFFVISFLIMSVFWAVLVNSSADYTTSSKLTQREEKAKKEENRKGGIWEAVNKLKKELTEIWQAVDNLQTAVTNLQGNIINLQAQLNALKKNCPEDMAKINDYCIDKEANQPNFWEDQVKKCGDEGKRICLMSEWHYACQLNNSEIAEIGKLIEWADDYRLNLPKYLPGCLMTAMGDRSEKRYARCCKDL